MAALAVIAVALRQTWAKWVWLAAQVVSTLVGLTQTTPYTDYVELVVGLVFSRSSARADGRPAGHPGP